ncbi:uncharacterized protein C8Q71DRAFT_860165 [Rhodofomes roseus]|uniref:Uncharacterized protein n=1 Tax=Rhodofomes roseus TaxID=34475 RepID=A0ABQ8K9C8_9APHY|nr:uncharacterized protein C8Q71DRAFT_860165 [Rhodofomes roseus]KAH9833895.1 hypothetical protein C8Q71DRAFT_860165 [Rhodofomes roseus]
MSLPSAALSPAAQPPEGVFVPPFFPPGPFRLDGSFSPHHASQPPPPPAQSSPGPSVRPPSSPDHFVRDTGLLDPVLRVPSAGSAVAPQPSPTGPPSAAPRLAPSRSLPAPSAPGPIVPTTGLVDSVPRAPAAASRAPPASSRPAPIIQAPGLWLYGVSQPPPAVAPSASTPGPSAAVAASSSRPSGPAASSGPAAGSSDPVPPTPSGQTAASRTRYGLFVYAPSQACSRPRWAVRSEVSISLSLLVPVPSFPSDDFLLLLATARLGLRYIGPHPLQTRHSVAGSLQFLPDPPVANAPADLLGAFPSSSRVANPSSSRAANLLSSSGAGPSSSVLPRKSTPLFFDSPGSTPAPSVPPNVAMCSAVLASGATHAAQLADRSRSARRSRLPMSPSATPSVGDENEVESEDESEDERDELDDNEEEVADLVGQVRSWEASSPRSLRGYCVASRWLIGPDGHLPSRASFRRLPLLFTAGACAILVPSHPPASVHSLHSIPPCVRSLLLRLFAMSQATFNFERELDVQTALDVSQVLSRLHGSFSEDIANKVFIVIPPGGVPSLWLPDLAVLAL